MRRIHYSRAILTAMLYLLAGSLSAQEVLTGHFSGQQGKGVTLFKYAGASGADTVDLPFMDDFARGLNHPAPELWVDRDAFVNQQYPYNPPSIGVATMDAINAAGDLPPNANTTGYRSDELTSRPVNLDLEPVDSVYLSFYYQTGGRGDTSGGEFQDSLVVQYYDPSARTWSSVWSVSFSQQDTAFYERRPLEDTERYLEVEGHPHRRFYQAMVPVKRRRFLKPGFRFRFVNYASLSPNKDITSVRSNVDQWHIDFVRLDSARSRQDTVVNDIAFIRPMMSMLNNYESIPWSHFPDAGVFEMRDSIAVTYRNLSNRAWNITREFEIIDRRGDNETFEFPGGTADGIPPKTTETYPTTVNYTFPYDPTLDSALFEIRAYMITDTISSRAPYRWNDTISYMQKFYNYYAYDDGTAENGYGITGEGSQNAMVALRYDTYTPDTLQAVQIYFNQTLDSASRNTFSLKIWGNDNGRPGELLYEQSGHRPTYEDSLNTFQLYVLREKIYVEGTFFVGYQKYNREMLNVGFDVNRIHNDKLFYNDAGNWNRSQLKGSLMIRPVFGEYIDPMPTSLPSQRQKPNRPDLELYPNPVRDVLHLEMEGGGYRNHSFALYDMQGRLVMKRDRLTQNVSLRDLSPGVYVVRIRQRGGGTLYSRKIIVRQ